MRTPLVLMVSLSLILALAGCGVPSEASEGRNGDSVTITPAIQPTDTPRPTETPIPSPTPVPFVWQTYCIGDPPPLTGVIVECVDMPTPTTAPVPPGPEESGSQEDGGENNQQGNSAHTPTPVPTPRYRPAEAPAAVGNPNFTWSNKPHRVGNVLAMSAVIEGQSLNPSQVQVFSALRVEDLNGGRCTTDRPITFVTRGGGTGATRWQWEYCGVPTLVDDSFTGQCTARYPCKYVDDVPWVAAQVWEYTQRPRRFTTDPWIYDWSFSVDLGDDRVDDLDYDSRAGWIVIIWSGPNLLAKVWVEG